ncbi:MAG: ABC transporter substrate-binding protein [Actinomycetia bacterium]|nr:ABC transporter substrate-binding protein [Actinomycetes bacterium]
MAVFVLIVASCGGTNPDPIAGSSADPLAAGATSVNDPVPIVNDDDPSTILHLEQEWAAQRQRIVDSLTNDLYGVGEDDILRGPGQFELDLGDCPPGWDDHAGIDETTIRVGLVVPQSGNLSSFDMLAEGMGAYFDWINSVGGIDGRRIELITRDDGYDAARARAAVEDLLTTADPFMVTNVGSPGAHAVYDDLNAACVPHPFVVSAHPAWGDPIDHPFTTGFQLSYSTEALLWGAWIKQNLAAEIPVTVGALVTGNDFGQTYADAFQAWADNNPDVIAEVTFVSHDPTLLEVEEGMAEIVDLDPDVFLSMTTGQPCLSAVREAARTGLRDKVLASFTPSVCTQPSSFMIPLGADGDGFYVIGSGVKSTVDPLFADEPFIRFVDHELRLAGLDPAATLAGVGFAQYGWAHVEVLRLASELPGGLSRSNLVLALRSLDLQHPMLLDGVRFSTNGRRDGYPIEGAEASRYDAEAGAWFQQGATLDLNGSTPRCEWDLLVCGS